jgi:GMP synthase-like glutamine amidotransferase
LRVLSIVQQADAGPGVFAESVAERGDKLETWEPGTDAAPPADPLGYDAVMVFGGSMNTDEEASHPWLAAQRETLRVLLVAGVPLLGVCLGAQLVCEAAGGEVRRAARPEIGWHQVELTEAGRDDPLLGSLPPSFTGFQWHSYEFVPPDGAAVLARSVVCPQAAQVADTAWVIQFHAEVCAADAIHWIEDYESDPDAVRSGVDPEALAAQTRQRIGAWNELGRGLCRRFLDLAAARA